MSDLKKTYDFLGGEVLLFDKDLEWTSFDLVQRVRNMLCREMGIKKLKVGHAGTLDPLATGLMILCTGKSTKLIESFQEREKEYVTTMKLGATTPSFDMETEENSQLRYKSCNS
jgi:tRNA pseudouridine55 synthase